MSSSISSNSAQEHSPGRLAFQYRTLDGPRKEIRLLQVLPGSKGEPLRAKVVYEFLSDDDINPYETISYVWGDPELRGEIEVDGSVLDIPASSAAALRCMRRPDVCRRLWIDAICINQDDIPERNLQVTIMGEIYSRSSHNLIYLGEEDASTRSAIASLERALEEVKTRPGILERFPEFVERGGPPLKCEIDMAAVSQLCERPWFSRMWIVQEAVLAPVSTCYCGPEVHVNLLDLLQAYSYIYLFHPSNFVGGGPLVSMTDCVHLWPFIDPKAHFCIGLKEDGSLAPGESACGSLVGFGVNRECTDPRDYVFSIVGLVDQARARTPDKNEADRALLEVDYGKPFEHVLRDATRFSIQESLSLQLWNIINPHHTDESGDLLLDGLCSWVPPRDAELDTYPGKPLPWLMPRANNRLPVRRETILAPAADPDVLTLDGYAVADVVEVTRPMEEDLFAGDVRLADALASVPRMCHTAAASLDDPDPDLDAGGCPDSLPPTLTRSPYLHTSSEDDMFVGIQAHVRSVFEGGLKNSESEHWSEDVRLGLIGACCDRRVFLAAGGFVGQGPRCLRAGDRIVVLLGGRFPFAVRPLPRGGDGASGERFQLLGIAYLYGIMYGAIVRTAKDRGEELRTFDFV